MKPLNLCVMTEKGLCVLLAILEVYPSSKLNVFIGRDKNVENDFSREIIETCEKFKIKYQLYDPKVTAIPDEKGIYTIAISWKWMLKLKSSKIVVFHDSLLPRYRGFNPLVSMLINKEPTIGVTALYGGEEYDTGDIILQTCRDIYYPISISTAITLICELYAELATKIAALTLAVNPLPAIPQSDKEASYSLWRDESDYSVNWNWPAEKIARMVDAVGFPYKGARAETACGVIIKINQCKEVNDVSIENRTPGKIIFWDGEWPTIVCGKGLIKLLDCEVLAPERARFKRVNFRTRFKLR